MEIVRKDAAAMKLMAEFQKTPEGLSLLSQLDSGILSQDAFDLRYEELFSSFLRTQKPDQP